MKNSKPSHRALNHFRFPRRKIPRKDMLPRLPDKPQIERQIMDRCYLEAQKFVGGEQMPHVSLRVKPVDKRRAVGLKWREVVRPLGVAHVHGPVGSEQHAVPAVARRHHAVHHVYAAVYGLQDIRRLVYLILGLIDPNTPVLNLGSGDLFKSIIPAQSEGNLLDVAIAGIKYGFPVNFLWAIENGRFTQTLLFFLFGIMLGRKRLFYDEGNNIKVWKKVLIGSLCAFVILLPLYKYVPKVTTDVACISKSLKVALNMWKNVSMMLFIVAGTTLLYYRTSAKNWMIKIAPYGKMSLTNYVTQSIIGSFLYFGYGLGLHAKCGTTMSICIGIAFLILQVSFAHWWMARHKRGPLESIWHKLTWMKRK